MISAHRRRREHLSGHQKRVALPQRRRLTAIESSLINNTMLVQIALLAWLFLGESIGVREALGLLLAVLGVLLVQVPAVRFGKR